MLPTELERIDVPNTFKLLLAAKKGALAVLNTTKAPIILESIFNLPLLRIKQEIVFLSKVEVPSTHSKRIDFFVMSAFIN